MGTGSDHAKEAPDAVRQVMQTGEGRTALGGQSGNPIQHYSANFWVGVLLVPVLTCSILSCAFLI
jgi:hypothetical protein